MKVVLVHVDGKMPNLVLMKLSACHKRKDDRVLLTKMRKFSLGFLDFKPDRAYISCIFSWNAHLARRIGIMFSRQGIECVLGGSGVAGSNPALLDDTVEHLMPDYSLYGVDYSMGFTSRGCFRNCPWCVVPKKEGMIRDHAPICEFHHPKHSKIILLDNNFLASPKWKQNLLYIIQHKLSVNFNQGLDIRLINDDNADLLAHCRFRNWAFKSSQLHFAFDDPKIEDSVRKGIDTLKAHGISPRKLMFYMLVGFNNNTTFEEDTYRFNILRELGVDPFVMIYNNRKDVPILRHFARWVNKRVYKVADWKNYDHGDSQKLITVTNV